MNRHSGLAYQSAGVATATDALQIVKDYISLMKPGVLSLLLVSTLCPMVLAAKGDVTFAMLFFALLGGSLISGSASAINCIWDRDIDRIMERTKKRPIPAGRVTPVAAFVFSMFLGAGGLIVLGISLNVQSAAIALLGHFFYVFVYTIWLKRSTPQNIVIGGAAGAVPPLVGWAAVTGSLSLSAFLIFLIVFLWTPPHFWALALNKNKDYQRAGVPMLPVVEGEETTVRQMFWYAVSLVPATIALVAVDESLGWFSYVVMVGLAVVFAVKTYQLMTMWEASLEEREKKRWDVFGFSMIYLALFFLCMVIDSTVF